MIWEDSVLTSLAEQAEELIATQMPCITQRLSLAVRVNEPFVNLPESTIDIVSVTWKGEYLNPYPISDYIEASSAPLNVVQGKPRFYLFSGYGKGVLKLLPNPNETLAAAVIPVYTKDEIKKRFIVEIKRLPDVTGLDYRLPTYFAQRLIKDWVCSRAFLQECNGFNAKAAAYYRNKFSNTFGAVLDIYKNLFVAKRYEMLPLTNKDMTAKPPRPVLPSNFGSSY